MYERGAWCCLTTTASVHSRPRFIRTGSPLCNLESGRVPTVIERSPTLLTCQQIVTNLRSRPETWAAVVGGSWKLAVLF